jgi:hypothetical protein
MKTALALCILSLFTFKSCHAQQSRVQVSASVTVVEAIGVTAGVTAVTQANGGTLDVTTPLSIRGSAPRVMQVVHGGRARTLSAQRRSACSPPVDGTTEFCDVRARITAPAQADATILTYVVATVN